MRLLVLAALGLLIAASCPAQESCKVYFDVVQSDPHLPGGTLSRMDAAQEKWWMKRGHKKFPTACYDPQKATHKIVWWREVVGDNRHVTNAVDPRYSVTVRRTRDLGFAFVQPINTVESAKPLFVIEEDRDGTAGALEKAVAFLCKLRQGY